MREPLCSYPAVPSWVDLRLSDKPAYGAAGIGGGEGDRSSSMASGSARRRSNRAGARARAEAEAVRLETGGSIKLTNLIAPPESFPDSLPVSWALLGPLTLAAVPAEATTAAGLEIRRALDLKAGRSALIGLANEYISYATTPAEYAAQDYAGASTLWGPYEAPFLGCSLAGLKAVVTSGSTSTGEPGAGVHARARRRRDGVYRGAEPDSPFGPELAGERREAADEGLERVLIDELGRPVRYLPRFEWEEILETKDFDFAASRDRTIEIQELKDGAGARGTSRSGRRFRMTIAGSTSSPCSSTRRTSRAVRRPHARSVENRTGSRAGVS